MREVDMITENSSLSSQIDIAKVEPLLPNLILASVALSSIVFGSIVAVRVMDSALDLLVR
jgi:hypothetical protein